MKRLLLIIGILLVAVSVWGATQDFKGTINGNTITAGTGVLTMSAGKTMTVDESLSTQNILNNAKAQLISAIYNTVTVASINGLWIFDQAGAVTTVNDRSGNARVATMRDNAGAAVNGSTMTPGVVGHAPYITTDATHNWDVADNDAYSPTDGAGNDTAFSLVVLGNLADVTNKKLMVKYDEVTNTWAEYNFNINVDDKLNIQIYHADGAKTIGQISTPAASEGAWSTWVVTYDASETSAGILLYENGALLASAASEGLPYTGVTRGSAPMGQNSNGGFGGTAGTFSVVMYYAAELTAAQIRQLDYLLRAYAGSTLN